MTTSLELAVPMLLFRSANLCLQLVARLLSDSMGLTVCQMMLRGCSGVVSKSLGLSRRCHLMASAIFRVSLLIIDSSLVLGFEFRRASLRSLAKSATALHELSELLLAVEGWLHTFTAATDAVVVDVVLLPCRGVAVEASNSNVVGT